MAQMTMVQNNQGGPTILTPDTSKSGDYIEWQGKGDPDGGDVQAVGNDILDNTQFQRMLSKGIFSIVEEDSTTATAAMQAQQAHWDARQGSVAKSVEQSMEHPENKDFVVQPCVGPGANGQKCGVEVNVREKAVGQRPPLCPQHEGLAAQFIPEEVMRDGKYTTQWVRFSMGARESER